MNLKPGIGDLDRAGDGARLAVTGLARDICIYAPIYELKLALEFLLTPFFSCTSM